MKFPPDDISVPDFVTDYLDGVATPEQVQRLAAWLRESPDHLDAYASAAYLDGLIQVTLTQQEQIEATKTAFDRQSNGQTLDHLDLLRGLEPDCPIPLIDLTEDMRQREEAEELKRLKAAGGPQDSSHTDTATTPTVIVIPRSIVFLAIAAALGFAFWLGFAAFAPDSATPPSAPLAQGDTPDSVPPDVAVVSDTVGAVWVHGASPENDRLASGRAVGLEAGFAEVVFNNGTSVIIQGPAQIEPTGTDSLRLDYGRMTASVPSTARDFTVQSGDNIIQAGHDAIGSTDSSRPPTEIGLVALAESVEVQAYTGRVQLRSTKGSFDQKRVYSGHTYEVTASGAKEVPSEQRISLTRRSSFSFYAENNRRIQRLLETDRTAYHEVVAGLAPSAWWRFEPDAPILGTRLGKTQLVVNPSGTSHHLALDRRGSVDAGDVFDFNGKETFTLSCWVRPQPTERMFLLGRMGIDNLGIYRGYDLFLIEGHVYLQLKHTFDRIDGNLIRVGSGEPLAEGQWAHIVATYDGSQKASGTALYVNGVRQDLVVHNDSLTGSIRTEVPFRIGVRGHIAPQSAGDHGETILPHHIYSLLGGIDEVMVFDYGLNESAARRLYETSEPMFGSSAISPSE